MQLIKKETLAQVVSCELYEISKNTFFTEHLWVTASGVSLREIIKVPPQVKKIQEKFARTWIREYLPRKLFCEVLRPNPCLHVLQLSVYEKSAYNENICSVKSLGKTAAKIIQNIHEWVHIP